MKKWLPLLLGCWLILSLPVQARTLTPIELETILTQARAQFTNFLQLWQEERYFEMYEFGVRQSKQQLSVEEFATRMVELDWVPVNVDQEPLQVDFRFRTMVYVTTVLEFLLVGVEAPNIPDVTVWRVRWLLQHINPDIIFAIARKRGVF